MHQICNNCQQDLCIDVVIPTYKPVFKYLDAAINSVIAQTHNYCNLIVVIDQDDNEELERHITDLASPRLQTFIQKNSGQSVARNFGISKSKANFVALLDHDDYWLPNHLESLTKVVRNSPEAALYFSGVSHLDTTGEIFPTEEVYEIFAKNNLPALLSKNLMVWPSSIILNRKILGDELRFNPNFRGFEDDDFLIRIVISDKQIQSAFENRTTIIRDHSSRHSHRTGMNSSALLFENEYAELAKSLKMSKRFAKRFFKNYLQIFRVTPNKINREKLIENISSSNAVAIKPIINSIQLLPPTLLAKAMNITVRLSRMLR